MIQQNEEWKKIENETGKYYLEEFVVDYMYKNNISNIKPIKNHIYGEGYKEMNLITDDEMKDIRFIHSHIDKKDPKKDQQFFKNYIFRTCQRGR